MINHVSRELNRVYKLFKEKNPNFGGSVSIYGHSLGSVIAYDIATHQNIASVEHSAKTSPGINSPGIDLSEVLGGGNKLNNSLGVLIVEDETIDAPKLEFDIANLYCVGSPVGMFLFLSRLGTSY